MPVLQNLYQIFKLTSTQIVEAELNIKSYTKRQAINDGCLVSIGDNLVFHKIRNYYNDLRTHQEIFNEIQDLRKTLKICKKEGKINEARITNQRITDLLFVRDIVNVEVIRKSEYKVLAKNGFYVNGIHYVRFLAGAGQIRRNTITFVNEELYPYLTESLMCGLNNKITEINLAKLGAYFALAFSSILWVRTPRVCVVEDFETIIPKQSVDFIYKDSNNESHIEERQMDIALNSADGQGLIDPEFTKLWTEDMGLDYTPSSFVIRSVFIKGNLVPFDFKEYARREKIRFIKDKWGMEYNIEDIDVILSESQFKMHKYYNSWQEYLYFFNKYNIKWGVARYNKKYDDENVLTNYQYLQCLNIVQEDIKELIQPTVDWLKKICSGEKLYSLLFLFGCKDEGATYNTLYSSAQANFTKAVAKNVDMLQDGYVKKKIYRAIVECINKAKIGKIWIKGNYQFAISDPVAQCRSALGLPPKGLIPSNCVYSNFWNERGVEGDIDICRSPMIDAHEHNPCTLFKNEEADFWYQYIRSGIIFSIYDTSVVRMEDSDFDGDIVLTTNNPVFLRGSQKHLNVILYEKEQVPVQKVNHNNIVLTDIRGLGTGVGGFSNCATIIEAMRAIFNKESQDFERNELIKRKKLLREIVGSEIDRIKGTTAPSLPHSWKKFVKINADDDDVVKADKYRHNSLVISKKPYFFRYLYPELNKRFKQYENGYNLISKDLFGIKFKKLLAKKEKTEEEQTLVRRYQKFSPLIISNCTMNLLCKEFENIDFDIRFKSEGSNLLPDFSNLDIVIDNEILNTIRELYRTYNNKKVIKMIDNILVGLDEEQEKELRFNINDIVKTDIQQAIFGLKLSTPEILRYIYELSKEYKRFNWSFVWDILDDFIIDYIPQGRSFVPIRDEDGEEFLGQKYILKEVSKEDDNRVCF